MKRYRDKFNEGVKEKMKLQKLIQHQESTIKSLELELFSLQELIISKDSKYKELNKAFTSLNTVSNERNKFISNLQNKTRQKENKDKGHKLLLYQKEQEILFLRNIIKSTKNQMNIWNNSKSNINIAVDLKSNPLSNDCNKSNHYLASYSKDMKDNSQFKTIKKINNSFNAFDQSNMCDEDKKIKELKGRLEELLEEQ